MVACPAGRAGWIDALRREAPLRWAAIAVFVSAPVDNAWHAAFGRDAVLLSPPHLLAIAASTSLILGICGGLLPGRWPLTTVAVVYTVARIGIVVGLAASGFSTPIVTPIVAVAVMADLVAEFRWPWPVQYAAVVATVHVVHVPWLAAVPHGVPVEGQDLAVSAGVALVAAAAAGAILHEDVRPSRAAQGGVSAVLVLLIVIARARPAEAHDPGQGDLQGTSELTADLDGTTVRLDAAIHRVDCAQLGTPHLVARRAGMTRRAHLARRRPCEYRGVLDLPEDGRWFVYATFDNGSQHYETWLPVEVGGQARASGTRELYRPPTRSNQATQAAVGALLVLAAAVILRGSLRAAAAAPKPPRADPARPLS